MLQRERRIQGIAKSTYSSFNSIRMPLGPVPPIRFEGAFDYTLEDTRAACHQRFQNTHGSFLLMKWTTYLALQAYSGIQRIE